MNKQMTKKQNKLKGFSVIELVVVISVIAILASVLVPTFTGVIKKSNASTDFSTLNNINKLLIMGEQINETDTINDVYSLLSQNNISLNTRQENYEFVYNKDSNRFEYLQKGWKIIDNNIYSDMSDYRFLFNAVIENNKATGFKQFTGKTTYTYKYIDRQTNDVIIGDTITEDNTLRYWLHIPTQYDSRITYPLITYIHGSGGCLFLQYNEGSISQNIPGDSSFWESNQSFWMNVMNPNISHTSLRTSLRDYYSSIAEGSAFGGSWDSNFISSWFNWVKDHPEDDAFIIFVELNDEIWFENRGVYTINDKECEMLCIYNAYKAGHKYGEVLEGGESRYNTTYIASQLGPNVWFQLLTQLQDKLMIRYNINNQYVLGASLGGIATYDLISHYPTRYTVAFPCAAPCADISEQNVKTIKDSGTEVYAYHGASDGLVSFKPSKAFCDNLINIGGISSFNKISGLGHSSLPFKTYFSEIMEIIHSKQITSNY